MFSILFGRNQSYSRFGIHDCSWCIFGARSPFVVFCLKQQVVVTLAGKKATQRHERRAVLAKQDKKEQEVLRKGTRSTRQQDNKDEVEQARRGGAE